MKIDLSDPSLRDPAIRKGEFREEARNILLKDRDSRKYGMSVDTGGSIARALENAYKLGVKHGENAVTQIHQAKEDPDAPMSWHSIPPRPRSAFESICRFEWVVIFRERVVVGGFASKAKWDCYRKVMGEVDLADSFAESTLAPIIRLGLMERYRSGEYIVLRNTTKGDLTWEAAREAGNV